MKAYKIILAGVLLAIGAEQVWDADLLFSGRVGVDMLVFAVVVPAGAILFSTKPKVLLGAGGLAFILLVIARVKSPIPLTVLLVLGFCAAVVLILNGFLDKKLAAKDAAPS